jgi:hypothetical protein
MKQVLHRLWQWLPMVTLLAAIGCGPSLGPRISINWRSPKPEVKEGTPLLYQSIKIGEVKKVETGGNGFVVQARLYKKYAHYVTEDCTFMVQKGEGEQAAFIELRPLKKDSPPAKDGAVFAGSESELEAGVRALATDWKRTAVLATVAIGLILLLVFLTKLFFKLWALILCVAVGAVTAYYLSPWADQQLRNYLPGDVRTDLIAYAVAFLGGYIIATIIVGILKKPLRA